MKASELINAVKRAGRVLELQGNHRLGLTVVRWFAAERQNRNSG